MSSLGFPLLSLIIFLPLAGAFFILTIRGDEEDVKRNARNTALFTSTFTFFLSVYLLGVFDRQNPTFQLVELYSWFPDLGINYKVGVDGISIYFVLLSTFLTPLCILASWKAIQKRVKEYMALFLLVDTLMVGTFCALDIFLFYIFFEAVLMPMFIIIGVWGGPRRVYSAFKFFLYTLGGSFFMLIGLIAIYQYTGTSDLPTLMKTDFPLEMQKWLWLAFLASFMVKMPMWPMHTWLPHAHVEAPTGGSALLAGVLLKMGGFVFIRFSLPMLPEASYEFAPIIWGMSVVAIIYTSLVAFVQHDMKKMIAYSSVAHMGFVTLGMFTFTQQGIDGALFQMLSHGLVSAALFLCIGVLYDQRHTRELFEYGGVVKKMPKFAVLFMIFTMGAVGLPGTSGFIGEFLTIMGAFRANTYVALLAAIGIVLGAAYMLRLYKRIFFGEPSSEKVWGMKDIGWRETIMLVPMAILVIWVGVYPTVITKTLDPAVNDTLISRFKEHNVSLRDRVLDCEYPYDLYPEKSSAVKAHGEEH